MFEYLGSFLEQFWEGFKDDNCKVLNCILWFILLMFCYIILNDLNFIFFMCIRLDVFVFVCLKFFVMGKGMGKGMGMFKVVIYQNVVIDY